MEMINFKMEMMEKSKIIIKEYKEKNPERDFSRRMVEEVIDNFKTLEQIEEFMSDKFMEIMFKEKVIDLTDDQVDKLLHIIFQKCIEYGFIEYFELFRKYFLTIIYLINNYKDKNFLNVIESFKNINNYLVKNNPDSEKLEMYEIILRHI